MVAGVGSALESILERSSLHFGAIGFGGQVGELIRFINQAPFKVTIPDPSPGGRVDSGSSLR